MLTTRIVLVMAAGLFALLLSAQETRALEGRWQGTLQAGGAHFRLVLDVAVTEDRLYLGTLTSIDQGNAVMPIDIIEVDAGSVLFEVRTVGVRYEGVLDEQGARLTGTWTQGVAMPLEFERIGDAEPIATDDEASSRSARAETNDDPFGLSLHLEVPAAPVPFAGGGATHLAYELHLTNFGEAQLSVRRIEVVDGRPAARESALTRLEGAELHSVLRPVGARPRDEARRRRISDLRNIPAGRRAVAYLWITVEDVSAIPDTLLHRVTAEEQMVEGAEAQVGREDPLVLGAPLVGARWMAVNGPGNASIHRRALLPARGRASIAQRFAIDWVRLDDNGSTFSGDPEENASYFAYGADILAVADAVVAEVEDGIPENVPGLMTRAVPMTLETIAGNYVVLDLEDGRFAFYGHLRPGSIAVQPGERVREGDVIAQVGNSGNSTEPHLHFHVADGADSLSSEGVPYVIDVFDLLTDDGGAQPRGNELPMQNAVVRFPEKP